MTTEKNAIKFIFDDVSRLWRSSITENMMKQRWIISVAALIVVFGMGCKPSLSVTQTRVIDELDVAIRDASDYLNDNIPLKSKIVILNIQSSSADLSDYIIDELMANAIKDKNFLVVDRNQLDAIRVEQEFQMSGEVDDNDALAIGKFFGAQTIISGTMRDIGERFRLTIRALAVQTAQVQGQYNRNIIVSKTLSEFAKRGRGDQQIETTSADNGSDNRDLRSVTIFVDSRDSRQYRIVKIGTQTWMAEDLNYNAGSTTCYDNRSDNCDKYDGLLYSWPTAKNICPAGWHLPGDAEWTILENYVGSSTGKKLKSTNGWNNYKGKSGNGMDEYGFSALPGGAYNAGYSIHNAGDFGGWWSATESNDSYAWYRFMHCRDDHVGRNNVAKTYRFSVRCLKND